MLTTKPPIVLAVMETPRGTALIQQLEAQGVRVMAVSRRDEARAILQGSPPVPIVLTDENLPDGNWRDVINDVAASGIPAEIVVCTSGPEQPLSLCFELLDHGALGLMAEPFDLDQLQWLINTATSRSKTFSRARRLWAAPVEDGIERSINIPPQPVGSA